MDEMLNMCEWNQQEIYEWDPKPDITVYELALCIPILVNPKSFILDKSAPYFKHFKIADY